MVAEEKRSKAWPDLRTFIRWVGENQVIGLGRARTLQKLKDILFSDAAGKMRLGEIALDGGDGAWIMLDKSGAGGSAAERLNPECAGSGKEIEHARPHNCFAEAIEDGS